MGALKVIGATKLVTSPFLKFFHGIFITTTKKSWNYEEKKMYYQFKLKDLLSSNIWRYGKV
jgi:hypothetical protein